MIAATAVIYCRGKWYVSDSIIGKTVHKVGKTVNKVGKTVNKLGKTANKAPIFFYNTFH